VVQRYRQQFGNDLNDEFLKMLKIEANTLESLIDRELILQEASRLGLRVTDEEVRKEISEIPSFQQDGSFDKDLYNRYITYTRQTPEYFEALQRKELLIRKVQALISDAVLVSDDETRAWFNMEKTTARIGYVLFAPNTYKNVTASDEEIQTYYEEHADGYKSEPKTKIRYLRFAPEDYTAQVTVSDEDIEKYYTNNIENYETPKTVEARHILIKVDENATDDVVAEKELKARQIYDMAIKDGQDFAELAKTYSEGPSKDNGGYLGSFEAGKMVKPFSDKAFAMKAGEISEPVRTQFGWHIIKVEKVNEASKRPLNEVKADIEKLLAKEKAETMAYEYVDLAYENIMSGQSLEQAAKTAGHEVKETGWFTQAAGPAGMDTKAKTEINKIVTDIPENGISDVLEFDGKYYIVQVTGKKGAEIQPLDDVKSRVRNDLIQKMKDEKAKKAASDLIASVTDSKTKLEETQGFKETKSFDRSSRGTDLGIDSEVVQAAFGLSMGNALSAEPIQGRKGFYVIRLLEKKAPDAALFDKEKERIKTQLARQKESQTFSQWLSQLKAKSTIERNNQLIE
jgi:peptidyl-prolyl cis-trans isomerase D